MSLTVGNNTHPKNVSFGAKIKTNVKVTAEDLIRVATFRNLGDAGDWFHSANRVGTQFGFIPGGEWSPCASRSYVKSLIVEKFPVLKAVIKNCDEFAKNHKEKKPSLPEINDFLKKQAKVFGRKHVNIHFSEGEIEKGKQIKKECKEIFGRNESFTFPDNYQIDVLNEDGFELYKTRCQQMTKLTADVPRMSTNEKLKETIIRDSITTVIENILNKLKNVKNK